MGEDELASDGVLCHQLEKYQLDAREAKGWLVSSQLADKWE